MYIFAVALEDGNWHHVKSYTKARAKRKSTIKIWRSIKTHEDRKWTRKYHDPNPKKKCFGGDVVIQMKDGSKIKSILNVADAHPSGNRPFVRRDYIHKFKTLTDQIIDQKESERFLNNVQSLRELGKSDLHKLNIEVKNDLRNYSSSKKAIF